MAQQPVVSVIVPVHNRERSLARALESIQSQSFEAWETVIVDDASSDGSRDVAFRFQRDDPRIKLVAVPHNIGAQGARNEGIRRSVGDWIAFLDSDDEWLPSSIEDRLAVARREQVSVVHSQCEVLRPAQQKSVFDIPTSGIPRMSGEIYAELLVRPGPMYQGILAAREALERIGYLDPALVAYQEWDTSLRLARQFAFGFLETPSFIYRDSGGGRISGDLRRSARGYEQVVRKHAREVVRVRGRRVLAWHYRGAAARYREAGATPSMIRCATLSTMHWPFRNPLRPFVVDA